MGFKEYLTSKELLIRTSLFTDEIEIHFWSDWYKGYPYSKKFLNVKSAVGFAYENYQDILSLETMLSLTKLYNKYCR